MKGQKTGGRKKGTPNKTPAEVKEVLLGLFTDNVKQLKKDVSELTARDRLQFFAKVLPYIVPREVERLEVAEVVEQPLFADVADDEILNGD
jgi:hypothetical protein